MTHTKGPWEISDDKSSFLIRASVPNTNGRRLYVASLVAIPYADGGENQTLANANLIAAGPELLKELKAASARVKDLQIIMQQAFEEFGVTFHMCGSTYEQDKVDAAIDRAEGR